MVSDEPKTELGERALDLRLSPEFANDLRYLARHTGSANAGEVLRRAVALHKYLLEEEALGRAVLLEDKASGAQWIVDL
jgi:predicted DNA-binding protein